MMIGQEIEALIKLLSKLPGLGPRSGRRAALHLIKNKETALYALKAATEEVIEKVQTCSVCGNYDTAPICSICQDPKRDPMTICVVEDVSDVWAIERSQTFKGLYHILGGTLSAIDGRGPDQLSIAPLKDRLSKLPANDTIEIILALNATLDGQTTMHYLQDELERFDNVKLTILSHGIPVGGELDYLDDGTLSTAFKSRRVI